MLPAAVSLALRCSHRTAFAGLNVFPGEFGFCGDSSVSLLPPALQDARADVWDSSAWAAATRLRPHPSRPACPSPSARTPTYVPSFLCFVLVFLLPFCLRSAPVYPLFLLPCCHPTHRYALYSRIEHEGGTRSPRRGSPASLFVTATTPRAHTRLRGARCVGALLAETVLNRARDSFRTIRMPLHCALRHHDALRW